MTTEARTKEKKVTRSWRVCPKCKSRATKIFSLSSGLYLCQVCGHEYDNQVPECLGLIAGQPETIGIEEYEEEQLRYGRLPPP